MEVKYGSTCCSGCRWTHSPDESTALTSAAWDTKRGFGWGTFWRECWGFRLYRRTVRQSGEGMKLLRRNRRELCIFFAKVCPWNWKFQGSGDCSQDAERNA
ncbi:unnamed protein product [Amoebophrya sp. A120]|nr:unnamed protein product [Amoebophrya sp. A120]|eukprot:GSA120T00011251001.1